MSHVSNPLKLGGRLCKRAIFVTISSNAAKAIPHTLTMTAAAGILAGAGAWVSYFFGWTTQTAQQVVDTASDTNGLQTILGFFVHNKEQFALGFMTIALIVVLVRKFTAAGQGRSF